MTIRQKSEPDVWFHDIFRADGSPYDKWAFLVKTLDVTLPTDKQGDRP